MDANSITITQDENYVYFTLADGTVIKISKNDSGANPDPTPEPDPTKIIQFKDAAVEEICVAKWDINEDGKISEQEAAAVTDLGTAAFKGVNTIQTFDELRYFIGLNTISLDAFRDCRNLTMVTIPHNVSYIKSNAFNGCSNLTNIIIPKNVTQIESYSFYGCSNLSKIVFPNKIISIGDNAFYGCSSLLDITLPNELASIGDNAFRGCSTLKNITIPESITFLGNDVFFGCKGLSAFYGKYASADNRCLIRYGELIAFAPYGLSEYIIPDKVNVIGESAFYQCQELISITIPQSVIAIKNYAFSYCYHLKSLYCKPTNPPSYGEFMFNGGYPIIYVPISSVDAYKTTNGWRSYVPEKIIGYSF